MLRILLAAISFAAIFTEAIADIELPAYITDSMVVQQQSNLTVKGKANPNSTVSATPSWSNKTAKAETDDDGNFSVTLKTPKAGGPYTITFSNNGQFIVLRDIMAGEVWICSGQSNMEMPVIGWGRIKNFKEETAAAAKYPNIRVLQIARKISYKPQEDVVVNMGGWRKCSPASINNFSALAYLYARKLNEALNVPIGVIDCSWGGTPAEAWVNYATAKQTGGFETYLEKYKQPNFESNLKNEIEAYEEKKKKYEEAYDKAVSEFNPNEILTNGTYMQEITSMEKAGLGKLDGVVVFQHEFNISSPKDATIFLGEIDDDDLTYVNGKEIGKTRGFTTTRRYKIPASILKTGKNILTVVVTDHGGNGGFRNAPDDLHISIDGTQVPIKNNWKYKVVFDMKDNPKNPSSQNDPTVLYNAMLYPLHMLPARGFIWYQGEANEGRDAQYSKLFRGLIKNWRQLWGKEMPFYFVQLAGFKEPKLVQPESLIAGIRQAQAEALVLPKTGMATAVDIGDSTDIHPKNKQEVARRMSLLALHDVYGKNVVARAPYVKKCTFAPGCATIKFSEDIHAKGNSVPSGFNIELPDGKFVYADAKFKNARTIVVTVNTQATPKSVRYNWADYPNGNLYGDNNLPVNPFRSDKLVH